MNQSGFRIEQRLRFAGILLLLGLLTEAATLRSLHPLAFVVFVVVGGFFLAAGILIYLHSLVAAGTSGVDVAAQSEKQS